MRVAVTGGARIGRRGRSVKSIRSARSGAAIALVAASLLGCGEPPREDRWSGAEPQTLPARLSETGLFERTAEHLAPRGGIAYALAHPLFSDYAHKFRTVHVPMDAKARAIDASRTLAFPVGTHITKTFYYPSAAGAVQLTAAPAFAGPAEALNTRGMRLIETRVLRRTSAGWEAVSYLWDENGQDARKARAGALLELASSDGESFDYLVPDVNQCGGCHATDHGSGVLAPIGPKPGNLAAVRHGTTSQYDDWAARGLVEPSDAGFRPWPVGGSDAARAYLDANCAHCHSNTGAADTAGLDLRFDAADADRGLCKSPVAAGRGSGGRDYDIWPGRADASILLFRLAHTDPGIMMPELGRSLVHEAGVARIRAWIDGLEGNCDAGSLL